MFVPVLNSYKALLMRLHRLGGGERKERVVVVMVRGVMVREE